MDMTDQSTFYVGQNGAYATWDQAFSGDAALRWPVFAEITGCDLEPAAYDQLVSLFENQNLSNQCPIAPDSDLARLRSDIAASGRNFSTVVFYYAAHDPSNNLTQTLLDLGFAHRVLHCAPPVRMNEGECPLRQSPQPTPVTVEDGAGPIMAVIDDAIAYLNRQFTSDDGSTRVRGLWQQSHATTATPADLSKDGGQILTAAKISARDAGAMPPEHYYAKDAAHIMQPGDPRVLLHRKSHGTHVLDLAAGTPPDDTTPSAIAMRTLPILAVQLPRSATADTSGRLLEPYIARGLRWISDQAQGQATPRALIVNLSLGTLGGPGDDSGILATIIDHEMTRYERITGHPMRVVAAYGNARKQGLVARQVVTQDAPLNLKWVVVPDDKTASFVELQHLGDAADVCVTLNGPNGSEISLDVAWPDHTTGHWLRDTKGQTIGMISGLAGGDIRRAVIALAPTADGTSNAPSGLWSIDVTTVSSQGLVTARILRDDTLAGYWSQGRQTRFLHDAGGAWDPQTADMTSPAPDSAISNAGTASSFAGLVRDGFRTVAAGRISHLGMTPRPYSGEGATGTVMPGVSSGPDVMAPGDQSTMRPGISAAGTYSGTTVRFSGTSAAAPQVARAIAMAHLSSMTGAGQTLTQVEDTYIFDLAPHAPKPPRDTRRGFGSLA